MVSKECAKLLGLSRTAVDQINNQLSEAYHSFRRFEGEHMQPVRDNEEYTIRRGNNKVLEAYTFRLLGPIEDVKKNVRAKLKTNLYALLDKERADVVWTKVAQVLPDHLANLYTYQLDDLRTELNVRRYAFHRTVSGQYYPEEWDQYAPKSMTKILGQWRERVRESLNDDDEIKYHHPDNKPEDYSNLNEGLQIRWSTENDYIDIPKAVIPSLLAPGLDIFGNIGRDIIAALGLKEEECMFLKSKYEEMENQFRQLEKIHFHAIDDPSFNFQLDAFPDEAKILRDKWVTALDAHFDQSRARLIDLFVRKERSPIEFSHERFKYHEEIRKLGGVQHNPNWLNEGTKAIKIFIGSNMDQKGETHYEFRYHSSGGRKGSSSGSRLGLESLGQPFHHLLMPIISSKLSANEL